MNLSSYICDEKEEAKNRDIILGESYDQYIDNSISQIEYTFWNFIPLNLFK